MKYNFTDDYAKAREKAKDAKEQTNLESEMEVSDKRPARKRRYDLLLLLWRLCIKLCGELIAIKPAVPAHIELTRLAYYAQPNSL